MSENFGAWISIILHIRQFDVRMILCFNWLTWYSYLWKPRALSSPFQGGLNHSWFGRRYGRKVMPDVDISRGQSWWLEVWNYTSWHLFVSAVWNGLVMFICCRCFIVKWQSINVFRWKSWCLPFKFIDLVDYLMDFMVNTKPTRAKIIVEPEELFLLVRHLEGAYIPRSHQKKCVFLWSKLFETDDWLLNPSCFRENPPNKNPYLFLATNWTSGQFLHHILARLFCMISTGHIDAACFKAKEICLEKMERHLWVQAFWSQMNFKKKTIKYTIGTIKICIWGPFRTLILNHSWL